MTTLIKAYLGNGSSIAIDADGHKVVPKNVAIDLNAYPGTPGDIRFWMGGVHSVENIKTLLNNLSAAYQFAKETILERITGTPSQHPDIARARTIEAPRLDHKPLLLIADWAGESKEEIAAASGSHGTPPQGLIKYIALQGGQVLRTNSEPRNPNSAFYVHYKPDSVISEQAAQHQYDGIIVAAKDVPPQVSTTIIGRMGAGINNCRAQGAQVCNTPGVNASAVIETMNQILTGYEGIYPYGLNYKNIATNTANGAFDTGRNMQDILTDGGLKGKRVCIDGVTGNIGRKAAEFFKSQGCTVVGYGRSFTKSEADSLGIEYASSLEEAAKGADIITTHVALNEQTRGRIGESVLSQLAKNATVLNFGRAELIDHNAMCDYLKNNPKAHEVTDADIFVKEDGRQHGPLLESLARRKVYGERVMALPHVAADNNIIVREDALAMALDSVITALYAGVVKTPAGGIKDGFMDQAEAQKRGIDADQLRQERIEQLQQEERQKAGGRVA
jgi:lactate dehydrogenase-like 2-hydroxyacid dehydrogenase